MEIQEQPPKAFPFVRSEGSPFEVGRVHGATFGEQIQGSIAYYRAAFESDGLSWEEALTLAGRSGETLRAFDPAIADEMNGIAAGADVDPRTILAINFRTNLRRLKTATKDTDQECTTAALLPEVTATGHMLLAQNWDQRGRIQPHAVIIEQHTVGQPAILFLTEAGSLFRHGFNDAGVGIVGNALRSAADGGIEGALPTPVARRRALRSTTLAEARAAIESTPRSHAGNHIVGDAAGVAVDLEATPGKVFSVSPTGGVVAHANHFVNEEAVATVDDLNRKADPGYLYRDTKLRDALMARGGEITVEAVMEALKDHKGFPGSVCAHTTDITQPLAAWTLASSVIDLTERRMWTAPGPPCVGTFTEYSFS